MTTVDPRRGHALAAYRAGATTYEVAAQLEVHQSTIARWAAQADTIRRTGPRGRTDVPTERIVELRDVERLSYAAIAGEVGMSKTGVISRYRLGTRRVGVELEPAVDLEVG